jgi:DNA-binding transcriptional MerR regulator
MAKMQEIPNKLYFRIGEVSDIVGVKPYVLRYWESEFQDIKPSKSKSGQRLYKRRDVELLVGIKRLLYDERFTIDGARKRLKELGKLEGGKEEQVTAVPKQLEVFTERPATSHASARAERIDPGEKKVLVKIKRDLESLLNIIKE